MFRYIIRRLLWLIPVIIAVSFIVFSLMELAPGTIIDGMINDRMTVEEIAELKARYNLDKPMIYRYVIYLNNLVHGNLGVSEHTGNNVWGMYISKLPNTLLLSFASIAFGAAVGIPMGIFAARRAGRLADSMASAASLVGMSMPNFWLGLLLLLLFSSTLGWLPSSGNREGIRSLILPAITGGATLMAISTRQTRSSMLEVLKADYLRTARAKGVPEEIVIKKHALGNAWIPILTAIATALGLSLAGAVVVESVFAWPGVGRMAAEAVMQRDVTTATGIITLTAILIVIVQLIADLLYAFVDPRIKAKYMGVSKKRRKAAQKVNHCRGVAMPAEELPMDGLGPVLAMESEREAARPPELKSFATRDMADSDETAFSYTYSVEQCKKQNRFGEILYGLRRSRGAMAGFIIFAVILVTFIVSLFINFESVTEMNVQFRFLKPSLKHIFGTDNFGRDLLLRVIYGTRYTLAIGLGSVSLAVIVGVSAGSFAGYYGGRIEEIIMRVADVLSSIPGILLGMVIVTVLGQGLLSLIIAVGVQSIPQYIRMTRASVITVKNQEFVEAAHAIGVSNFRVIFTQVLPNGLAPIIVSITTSLGMAIIIASALSFLGFGVPIPHPEWGTLIAEAREFARTAPWMMTFPGVFIMLVVLAINMIGDGLRDALDPKMKRR